MGKDSVTTTAPSRQREKLQALDTLERSGLAAIEQLQILLDDPDPVVRSAAAGHLAEVAEADDAPILLHYLGDRDSSVRIVIAEGLGRLKYGPAAQDLTTHARNDRNSLVRLCAAEALGELGVQSPRIIEALLAAVETDRSPLVRAYAAESLGRLGVGAAAPVIRHRLLRERSTRARASMLEALSRLGDAGAFDSLLGMIRRVKDFGVRTAVLHLVQGLASPERIPLIAAAVDTATARDPKFAREHRWFVDFLREHRSSVAG